jgi:hypothetical protein
MVRKFNNCTATIYSLVPTTVRGSLVQGKTAVYEDIPGGFWKARRSYGPTALGVQTNQNAYTLCIEGKYTGVAIGYIVLIEWHRVQGGRYYFAP